MKRIFFLISLILLEVSISFSQNKYVNLEIAGTNGLVGIALDNRFSAVSKLGYKVGISYGFEKNDGVSHWYFTPVKAYYAPDGKLCNYFSVPMNINYLIGKDKHFIETALGISLFATDYDFKNNDRIGYFAYGRIAYRFESKNNPLLFSVGVDMPFKTPASGLGYSIGFSPLFSIGYRL